jgi:OFA family oxalate/formate antiporter-like MFS transporter
MIKGTHMANNINILGMPPESGRWLLVIVGMIFQLCLGAVHAYGVIRVPLLAHFKSIGLSPSTMDMTGPYITFLMLFALTMPLASPYIHKIGPRKVSMIGGVLLGSGWFMASYATSPMILAVLYGVIGGIGVGIAYGVPIAVSAAWFPDKRGLAVGLTVLGFGISSALILQINKFLAASGMGIMDILKLFGVAFIIITIALSMLMTFPPVGWRPAGVKLPTHKAGSAINCDFMLHDMKKTSTFYGLWICYAIGTLAGLTAIGIAGPVGHDMLVGAGINDAVTRTALITNLIIPFAMFNGGIRPIFGDLTDKLGPRNMAIITYVFTIAACLLIYTNYASQIAYTIGFTILWGCLGSWLAIAPTATASYFGTKDYARNYGLVFTAYGIGSVIGGIISAQIKDIMGAFQSFFLIVAALALIGIIVAFMLLKPSALPTA